MGRSELIHQGEGTAYLAVGSMVETAEEIYQMEQKAGRQATVVNARFVKPIDTNMLDYLAKNHTRLVTLEENVESGGFGSQVLAYMSRNYPQVKIEIVALPDQFVEQGDCGALKRKLGLDARSVFERVHGSQEKNRSLDGKER